MESGSQNWNADDYAKNSSVQFAWAEELITKLDLNGSESVLDIGCGDGKVSARIAQVVKDGYVLGIDSSESMIQHASKQYSPLTCPNLTFRQMDATEINLFEKFDIAFSNAVLHWVKDQRAVLQGVHSCLKPGGRILFQMGGLGNAAEVLVAIREIISRNRWRRHFEGFTPPYHFYSPKDYETWLVETGFRPERVELIPKDMKHQGIDAFRGWLRTTWFPYTDCVPSRQCDAFIDELVEVYMAVHPADSFGNMHVGMVRLEVKANAI
jgi:trans-aconitate methyltransferase